MGKLTISMAMFNSFLYVYQRVDSLDCTRSPQKHCPALKPSKHGRMMENVSKYLNVKLYDKLDHMTMGSSHMSYFLTDAARTHVLMWRFVSLFVTAGIIH